ncbi:kinase [Actinoplanes sp. NPDC049802]|uniref:GHMP family kinase ATP-binding protein n=1 Tax=Actinoplanes sp. NPDC049802 TaxID=3154742 RepID=UPI0033F353F8
MAHGTFGELLQGVLPDGDLDFLVTFPITHTSVARFEADPTRPDVVVRPPHKIKSRLLAERILRTHGRTGGALTITTTLPEGKGLASSSADLVATARAVGEAMGLRLLEQDIESYLRDIEPTDGVMYPGIVAFYHREVRLREHLGYLPPLTVVGHDSGGMVNTVVFNRSKKPRSDGDKREYQLLLDRLAAAIRAGDLATVGAVATRSAEMNATQSPRRHFGDLLRICRDVGGLGLVLAHSGTNLGILLPGDATEHADEINHIRSACAAFPGTVSVYRSLGPQDRRSGQPRATADHPGT